MSRLTATVVEERSQQRGEIEDAREVLTGVRDSMLPGSTLYLSVDEAVHHCDEALRSLR